MKRSFSKTLTSTFHLMILLWLSSATLSAAPPTPNPPNDQYQLTDTAFRIQTIRLLSATHQTVRYFDANRTLQTKSTDAYLSLRPKTPNTSIKNHSLRTPNQQQSYIKLTDGQCFAGQMKSITKQGDVIWLSKDFGPLTISLDRLAEWHQTLPRHKPSLDQKLTTTSPLTQPIGQPHTQDQLRLTNNDQLNGFVNRLTPSHIVFESLDGQTTNIPWTHLAHLTLANPMQVVPCHWLVTQDGTTRIALKTYHLTSEELTYEPNDSLITLKTFPLERLDHLQNQTIFQQRSLLAYQPTQIQTPTSLGIAFQPYHDGTHLYLHAPQQLEYQLPANVHLIHTTSRLHVASTDSRRIWAHAILTIQASSDTRPIQHIIDAHTSPTPLTLPLTKTTRLTIDLNPGHNGYILDRIRLDAPLVLIRHQRP